MTIDEAIAHAKEVADEMRQQTISEPNEAIRQKVIECIDEYEQLAEWLEELKCYRNDNDFSKYADKLYKVAYNKAIDEFAERLIYKIKSEIDDCADELEWIEKIAKQLKGE